MRASRAWRPNLLIYGGLAAIFVVIARGQAPPAATFASEIRELSEQGGSFDTDNLISNERSYLHVIPALKQSGAKGGAYIGVGPDQNFSYIAASRPAVAFIIDVRRDNLLLQLLFKALFQISPTRAEYLSHLFARRLPPPPDQWRTAPLEKIAALIEATDAQPDQVKALRKQLATEISGFGLPLSAQDMATIERFHQTFINAGLSLKFQTFGRAPRDYYPSYRELLFETDRNGRQANFLISDDDYQFVRNLELHDAVVPVIGNLAGSFALGAIGRDIKRRGETLSTLYVSNVELYLFQNGVFQRYADTVSSIPHSPRSLLIRSVFVGPGFWSLPDSAPGYASASLTQRIDEFVSEYHARKYLTYDGLIAAHR